MALDAIAVRVLTTELNERILNSRIDKISQPERDEIVIHCRTFTENLKLVLSASSAHPRLHLTNAAKKNPQTAPMFCMLLRKHLGGGKITAIEQLGFERIVKFSIESYNELGDLTTKYLIIEIMGRHSNIILSDNEYKILDSIKHIDFTISSVRQVLPGLTYTEPPKQNKIPLIDFSNEDSLLLFLPERADKAIMSQLSGISPIIAREFVYNAFSRTDVMANSLNTNQAAALKLNILKFVDNIKNNNFSPCTVTDIASGKILDFSALNISQYENAAKITEYKSMNELVDDFYSTRDMHERMKQKSSDLTKLLNNSIERTSKKLVILKRTIDDAKDREKYKVKGDLITANIYCITQGQDSVTVNNYYKDEMPQITISLDPSLSPAQNAQKYYKKYTKAKTAQIEAAKQVEMTKADLEYLESTLSALENAETESDLNAIRAELIDEGYLNRKPSKKRIRNEVSKPMRFLSSDGFDIYVGRNNTQNDYLTLKFANTSDIWFHTKNIHGSHTVIKLGLDKNVPDVTIREAAAIAAYYSKARESSQVPVDYTQIKNVKKPKGAKPGMVIYDHYNTIYITPGLPDNNTKQS